MNLLYFLFIIVALFVSALIYFKIAEQYNIIDRPNERSSHKGVVLRGGGVIFVIGVILYYLLFGFSHSWFFWGLILISFISLMDDVVGVPSRYRIVVHFIAMLLMFTDCGFYSIPWYYTLVALVVGTGIINAYNFMDGINGITGGYTLVVVASFWFINNYITDFIDNNFLYSTGFALLVFNFFNFRTRARCFAGDVGSVSIAFIVVFLLGRLIIVTGNFLWLTLLLLYGIDTVFTIIYRLYRRENIFEAHRLHLYQLLANEHKIPHPVVSLIYMITQAIVSIIFIQSPTIWTLLSLAIPAGCCWLFLRLSQVKEISK